jgi:hypothetical protein
MTAPEIERAVERAARAIARTWADTDQDWEMYVDEAQAVLAAPRVREMLKVVEAARAWATCADEDHTTEPGEDCYKCEAEIGLSAALAALDAADSGAG